MIRKTAVLFYGLLTAAIAVVALGNLDTTFTVTNLATPSVDSVALSFLGHAIPGLKITEGSINSLSVFTVADVGRIFPTVTLTNSFIRNYKRIAPLLNISIGTIGAVDVAASTRTTPAVTSGLRGMSYEWRLLGLHGFFGSLLSSRACRSIRTMPDASPVTHPPYGWLPSHRRPMTDIPSRMVPLRAIWMASSRGTRFTDNFSVASGWDSVNCKPRAT